MESHKEDSTQVNLIWLPLKHFDVWDLADLAQEIFRDLAAEIFGDLADLAKWWRRGLYVLVWPWNKSTCRFDVDRIRINKHKSPQWYWYGLETNRRGDLRLTEWVPVRQVVSYAPRKLYVEHYFCNGQLWFWTNINPTKMNAQVYSL